jgi:hypothetical protein
MVMGSTIFILFYLFFDIILSVVQGNNMYTTIRVR